MIGPLLRDPPKSVAPGDDAWLPLVRGDQHWRCAAGWGERLLDANGLRLREWEAAHSLRVIKTGPHRTVWHTPALGGLYVKQYRVTGLLGTLQHLVRPSRGELEWMAARRIQAAGIPTFDSLAVGVVRRGRRVTGSWLVTQEIAGVIPVDELVETIRRRDDRPTRRLRTQLAHRLGEIVARLHAAGLLHRDLHAGNFLARLEADQSVSVWLIDLHAVDANRRLGLPEIEWNLGQLNNFFVGRATPSERLRFLKTWHRELASLTPSPPGSAGGEGRGEGGERSETSSKSTVVMERGSVNSSPPHPRPLSPAEPGARGVELSLRAAAHRFQRYCDQAILETWERGDEKWRRGNRRLIIADTRRARCRGLSHLGRELLGQLRDRTNEILREMTQPGSPSAVAGRSTRLLDFAPPASWRERLVRRFRNGPAALAWETGHALLRRGIPGVRPVAFVEPKSGTARPVVILDEPADSAPLAVLLEAKQHGEPVLTAADECRLAERLARLVRRLHLLGFVHRRLSAGDLRVTPELEGMIDGLTEIERCRNVDTEVMAGQLALLAASTGPVRRTLSMRFLRAYAGRRLRTERKLLWRRIQSLVDDRTRPAADTGRVRRAA